MLYWLPGSRDTGNIATTGHFSHLFTESQQQQKNCKLIETYYTWDKTHMKHSGGKAEIQIWKQSINFAH